MATGLELLTTEEMAQADKLAVELGVPSLTLMENAGRAVAVEAMSMVPPGARIAVVCGPGNNGGDGFVAARLLREAGHDVEVSCTVPVERLRGDAAAMAARWSGPVRDDPTLTRAALTIDAVFGAGLTRDIVPDSYEAELIGRMNPSGDGPLLAVDVPSGVDGTTGAVRGFSTSATRTITFFRRKPGHLLMPGRALCGEVVVADIGIPARVLSRIEGRLPQANARASWLPWLPRPRLDGHKYTRGHAVVVSGGIEMSGAARLCARGALRMGAGLVTVASPPDALQAHAAQLNATLLKAGTTPADIARILSDTRFTAVGIGPGLGRGDKAFEQVMAVLASGTAAILDADALTVAAAAPETLFRSVAGRERSVVLTPHEGEFRRLFPDVAGSKLDKARAAAALSGAVVLLKGPDTVIAAPDGRAAINENAPPTLATAGSGDVLAGFVTGLLAQGMPSFEAACASVWLHGECANVLGPGLIAEDISEALPRVLARLLAEVPA
ncbi:MAG: NAD(P)H-hydrate dehydratase [Hyphomicrobiaceae bacterium]